MKKIFKRTTVTAALPYANGPIHIGHLAGCFLPADIYVKYLRLKGDDVLFVCGSDEHGVPITITAEKEKATIQATADKYHNIIKDSLKDFGVDFDIYSRTSSEIHRKTASDFFLKLHEKGILEEKVTDQFFDEERQQFLADRYIKGECPKCGYTEAYGDQCEKCGSTMNPTELINPKSTLSSSNPILKPTKHWYLPLQKFQNWLEEWILSDHKNDWKQNVYQQCKSWLDAGLQPRAITRDLSWGIPVPLENATEKVLYVWFDAPIGYISATKEWAQKNNKNWEPYWKDSETRLIHFIGKDNIVFHCIIFPTMLRAHGEYILPDNVPAHEFLNLEGKKISTSRKWAIWLNDFLQKLPDKQDALRYALCANFPENRDCDFTLKDFQAKNNSELVAILGNVVNRVLHLRKTLFKGEIKELNEILEEEKNFLQYIENQKKNVSNALEQFKFKEALTEAMNVARELNKYLADTEPWKIFKDNTNRAHTIIAFSIQVVANLSILLSPFIPFCMQKIQKLFFLDEKNLSWKDIGRKDLVKKVDIENYKSLLFQKIEDEELSGIVG